MAEPIPAEYADENENQPSLYNCSNLPEPIVYAGAGPNGTDLVLPLEGGTITIPLDYELYTYDDGDDATLQSLQGYMLTYLANVFGIGVSDCSGYNVTEGLMPMDTKIISISSMPADAFDQVNGCDPSLDPGVPSTNCTAINGYWTASYIGFDESAVIRTISLQIREGMNNIHTINITDPNIAALSFVGRRVGGSTLGGDSLANPIMSGLGNQKNNNSLTATGGAVVASASVLFATVGILLCRWRRRKTEEDRIYQEEYGDALDAQPGLDHSFYHKSSKRGFGSSARGKNSVNENSENFHKSKEFYADEAPEYDTWSTQQDEEIMTMEQKYENQEGIIQQQETDGKLAPLAPGEREVEDRDRDREIELLRKEALMGISQGFMLDRVASSSAMSSSDTDRICTFQAEPQSIYSLNAGEESAVNIGKVPLYPPPETDHDAHLDRKEVPSSHASRRNRDVPPVPHSERKRVPPSHSERRKNKSKYHSKRDNAPIISPSERETNEQIFLSARNEVLSSFSEPRRDRSLSPSKRKTLANPEGGAKEKSVSRRFYLDEKLNDDNNNNNNKNGKKEQSHPHHHRNRSKKDEIHDGSSRGKEKSVGKKFYLNDSLNVGP